jgi:ketosteroid isomerase-like protein
MRYDEAHPQAPAAGEQQAWIAALFRAIDAKDIEGFLGFLAEDARFAFANFPVGTGAVAIRATLAGFFAQLDTLAHTIEDAWSVPGHVIVRGNVRYTRRDGRVVAMPFCNVLGMERGRVADYRIYIDPSPLAAA